MITRILSLDWQLSHPRVHLDDFFTAPALSGFDAVCVDPRAISDRWTYDVPPERDGVRRTYLDRDRGFGRVLAHLFAKRRGEAGDLLYKAGGIIVCRLRPRGEPLEIIGSDGLLERLDRYSFLPSLSLVDRQHQFNFPTNARFLPRRGDDVIVAAIDDPFADYLRKFPGHVVYHAVYQDILDTPIERFATVLAHNRVGDIVALSLPFDEGRLVLLPPVEGVSPAREADALVQAVEDAVTRPPFLAVPDWLSGYSLPGEDALADELKHLIDRRDRLAAKVDEVQARLEKVVKYKRLLYAKGRFGLLPAVAEAFRALGFTVEDSGYDLLLRSDVGDAIGAVAATDGTAVDLPAYRRLLDWVDRARTAGTGPDKGILVVNAAIGIDPKRRKTQFTEAVLRGCKSQRFCLITTYSLYKLVLVALADKDDKSRAALRRKILECEGEFRG